MYRKVTYNSRINSDDLIYYNNLDGDRGVDYIAPSQLTILSQKFKPNKSFVMNLVFMPTSGIIDDNLVIKICDTNFSGTDFSVGKRGLFVITGYNQTSIKCTPIFIGNKDDTKLMHFSGVFEANGNNTYKLNNASFNLFKDINTTIAHGTINIESLAVSPSAAYVVVPNKIAFKNLIIKYI